MIVARLRASPRHGGTGSKGEFYYYLIRRGGAPSGAAAFILNGIGVFKKEKRTLNFKSGLSHSKLPLRTPDQVRIPVHR
jgi:hypothetical protein